MFLGRWRQRWTSELWSSADTDAAWHCYWWSNVTGGITTRSCMDTGTAGAVPVGVLLVVISIAINIAISIPIVSTRQRLGRSWVSSVHC
jgi:hypothetical protein